MGKKRQRRGDLPFAKNLRKIMRERGVSARSLSKMTNVKASTLGDWLAGAAPTDLLAVAEVAKALKVDFQVLLLGTRPVEDHEEKTLAELFEIEDHPEFSGVFLIEAKRLRRRPKTSN
ncbi:MAG: helix-turn-helix transcriptional regulator [Bdellovibrionaceae bacterium]|nr:helix-turn-helix transcriptional regulator [Pseudobdellovibrionaceae bacterium]